MSEPKQTYSLNCDNCVGVFQSPDAFPEPQLCPKCSKPSESRLPKGLRDDIRFGVMERLEREKGIKWSTLICDVIGDGEIYKASAVEDFLIECVCQTADEFATKTASIIRQEANYWREKCYNDTMSAKKSGWDDAEKFYKANYQQRVEGIKREIEEIASPDLKHICLAIPPRLWRALWKEAGI